MTENQKTQWVTNVPVATIWTSPTSPREIDRPGISNPVFLKDWYEHLTVELRKNMCDDNLVQSQLLYGEEVIVDEINEDWAKVIAVNQSSNKDERGYPGWVPLNQLKEIDQSIWETGEIAVVTKKSANLIDKNDEALFELSYLTYLPVIHHEDLKVKVMTPEGEKWLLKKDVLLTESIEAIPKGSGQEIIETAKQHVGLDYFWGGMSSYGYDCSGFVYNMHKAHGYLIPRDASDQANEGQEVSEDEKEPGDLLLFTEKAGIGHVDHVGFYYGDGKMIHTSMSGHGLEIIPFDHSHYREKLYTIRRYHHRFSD